MHNVNFITTCPRNTTIRHLNRGNNNNKGVAVTLNCKKDSYDVFRTECEFFNIILLLLVFCVTSVSALLKYVSPCSTTIRDKREKSIVVRWLFVTY